MSIKLRLLLSYIAMTIIPVVLFAMVAAALASLFLKDLAGTGDRKGLPAIWETSNQRDELISGVKFIARVDPHQFSDSAFLKKTDEQLNQLHAGLVVIINKRITFASPYVDSPDLYNQLQEAQINPDQNRWEGRKINGRFTMVKYDIAISDHSAGTVYVLSDQNLFIQNIRMFFPMLVLSLLLVIGLTMVFLPSSFPQFHQTFVYFKTCCGSN